MNVTLLTVGSRGDVQPYVALGAGLKEAGHTVRVAAPLGFRDLVVERGLQFAAVAPAPTAVTSSKLWQKLWRRWQESGEQIASLSYYTFRMARLAGPVVEAILDDYWAACRGTDLVISTSPWLSGLQLAAEMKVPHCWALFQPMSRTRAFPHFLTPSSLRLGPRFNDFTYRFAVQIYWLAFKPSLNRWLKRRLARPPLSRLDLDVFPGPSRDLILYGISPRVVPRPYDWGDHIQMCGYWFLNTPPGWQPPDELVAFVNAGPAPLYVALERIGFSSRDDLLSLTLDALVRTRQRGVLFTGGCDLDRKALPEAVVGIQSTAHDWLFPRVAAVVHHGGAGTTARALWAGVPSVGVPGFNDQPFWSRRIAALGVGPEPIPRRRLTAARLGAAIEEMMENGEMRARASRLGAKIRHEQGVRHAVDRLHDFLDRHDNGRIPHHTHGATTTSSS